MTKIRCYDTATQIFRVIDAAELPHLEIETDALTALRRVRAGDYDFVMSYEGAEIALDDISTLEVIATRQEPNHLSFLAA